MSWLKKNELEIKRHVTEIRDNIRTNWSTTGQELGRELRQLWQNSRPGSPAPSARNSVDLGSTRGGLVSPTTGAKSHLSRVETLGRPDSPVGNGRNEDFATGYSLGLIGGVRAWVSFFFSFRSAFLKISGQVMTNGGIDAQSAVSRGESGPLSD